MAVIETERLRLREWSLDDLDALAEVFAEPSVWRFPFGRGFSREETRSFLERQVERRRNHGFEMWAAERKADGDVIGFIGLAIPHWLPVVMPAVEVGWRLHPKSWGLGLATEGGGACLRYGFETLGLDRIVAIFDPDNLASGRVMDRLHFTPHLMTTDPRWGCPLEVRAITVGTWTAGQSARPPDRSVR